MWGRDHEKFPIRRIWHGSHLIHHQLSSGLRTRRVPGGIFREWMWRYSRVFMSACEHRYWVRPQARIHLRRPLPTAPHANRCLTLLESPPGGVVTGWRWSQSDPGKARAAAASLPSGMIKVASPLQRDAVPLLTRARTTNPYPVASNTGKTGRRQLPPITCRGGLSGWGRGLPFL